jgi:hypothetical protein
MLIVNFENIKHRFNIRSNYKKPEPKIIIPKNGDIKVNLIESPPVRVIKKLYNHCVYANTPIRENFDDNIQYNLYIVYFINCEINPNYMDWLKNQINMVTGFSHEIYIVSTISPKKEEQFRKNVLQLYPFAKIECHYENEYEYRGILKAWDLGQVYNQRTDIILYFHSKGLTHRAHYENNRHDNYNIILKDYEKIKEIYSLFPTVDKIGHSCGGLGWVWYNFWYVRGSYLSFVEKPIKTERRHYYEDWLSRKVEPGSDHPDAERPFDYYKNTVDNCYGFYTDNKYTSNIGCNVNPCDIICTPPPIIPGNNYIPQNVKHRFGLFL